MATGNLNFKLKCLWCYYICNTSLWWKPFHRGFCWSTLRAKIFRPFPKLKVFYGVRWRCNQPTNESWTPLNLWIDRPNRRSNHFPKSANENSSRVKLSGIKKSESGSCYVSVESEIILSDFVSLCKRSVTQSVDDGRLVGTPTSYGVVQRSGINDGIKWGNGYHSRHILGQNIQQILINFELTNKYWIQLNLPQIERILAARKLSKWRRDGNSWLHLVRLRTFFVDQRS